jgi:hypothetical protein
VTLTIWLDWLSPCSLFTICSLCSWFPFPLLLLTFGLSIYLFIWTEYFLKLLLFHFLLWLISNKCLFCHISGWYRIYSIHLCVCVCLCVWYWGYWTQGLFLLGRYSTTWPTLPALFLGCVLIFEIGSCELSCLGWPQTAILLISASQVARIVGVNHWHPAILHFYFMFSVSYMFKIFGFSY